MQSITSKAVIKAIVADVLQEGSDADALAAALNKHLLQQKVRFPLLEYAAGLLYDAVPDEQQLNFTDSIMDLHTMGGNVLAGVILQKRLDSHLQQSIEKACAYMITGGEWYVCDIIGERVMGHALLTQPEQLYLY